MKNEFPKAYKLKKIAQKFFSEQSFLAYFYTTLHTIE